jgi:hypothetical protein
LKSATAALFSARAGIGLFATARVNRQMASDE